MNDEPKLPRASTKELLWHLNTALAIYGRFEAERDLAEELVAKLEAHEAEAARLRARVTELEAAAHALVSSATEVTSWDWLRLLDPSDGNSQRLTLDVQALELDAERLREALK